LARTSTGKVLKSIFQHPAKDPAAPSLVSNSRTEPMLQVNEARVSETTL
jgi:hypothetical protein